jgi:hypothetical protein
MRYDFGLVRDVIDGTLAEEEDTTPEVASASAHDDDPEQLGLFNA